MMFKYSVVTIMLLLFLSCVPQARTVVAYPSDDSFVWGDAPNHNYGSYNEARIGKDGLEENRHMWTALMFDLTPYSGITLDSAKIAIYIFEADGTFPPNEVWIARCSSDWDENEITWNNRPNYHDWHVPPAPEYTWWTIDVTTWAQAWINETYPNYGFWVGTNATSGDWFHINTKEEPGTIADPQLILHYTGFIL